MTKICILTTQTPHHTWFVQKLAEKYSEVEVVLETIPYSPKFETKHKLDDDIFKYERDYFFNDHDMKINTIVSTFKSENINDKRVLEFIEKRNPSIVISFGVGLLKKSLIKLLQGKIINLHGGDPEFYRGLDSHLWAIYHDDYDKLTTTIHVLNSRLDDGDIILKQSLDLSKISEIHQLRTLNTEACLALSISAIEMHKSIGRFVCHKQNQHGRYYSFMPKDLKEICIEKFMNYKGMQNVEQRLHTISV